MALRARQQLEQTHHQQGNLRPVRTLNMAGTDHHKVIALFDVDGTLTVPRKVLICLGWAATIQSGHHITIPTSSCWRIYWMFRQGPGSRSVGIAMQQLTTRRADNIGVSTEQGADQATLDFMQELRKVRWRLWQAYALPLIPTLGLQYALPPA